MRPGERGRRVAGGLLALVLASAAAAGAAGGNDYVVEPPAGKMPWPQHRPDMSPAEYRRMIDEVFIVNNFAEYQWSLGGSPNEAYFHSGIDIVLPNGTTVHSIADGYVRAVSGSPPHYATVVVEDADRPGWAWHYTHVWDLQAKVGDLVRRGQPLASVNFIVPGVDHVHLSRGFLKPGGSWSNFFDIVDVNPEPFFVFPDSEPPGIETPFHYLMEGSDRFFPRGAPTLVRGDVDIVVGMRDTGEYSRSKGRVLQAGFLMTLSVARAELAVHDEGGRLVLWREIDFNRIWLDWRRGFGLRDPAKVAVVYYAHDKLQPPPLSMATLMQYYVLTNWEGVEPAGVIDPARARLSWSTAGRDELGRPAFPNGDYVVTVTAYDTAGNKATARDTVRVAN